MRWATVCSDVRNARAISSVVRPPSRRSVRAVRASVPRTGWQVMNMRRRRSSSTSSSTAAARSGPSSGWRDSMSRPSSSCFRCCISLRRMRSIARCLAVAMSQPPGLSGTPCAGHCSSAATSASWASSSARPTSRVSRVSPAISLADSMRQTASMTRWVSVVTRERVTNAVARAAPGAGAVRSARARRRPSLLLLARGLGAEALLLLAQLGRECLAEVLGLEDLTELDRRALALTRTGPGHALHPLDRLLLRLHLDDPEAGDQLLGLGERPVSHGGLAVGEPDPRALRARVQALAGEQHAGLHELFVELAHRSEDLGARQHARLGLVVGLHQDHETHGVPPCGCSFWVRLLRTSNGRSGNRQGREKFF